MVFKKNPLVPKKASPINRFVNVPHSAGILDDHAVRKNIATKEGTIEKVPVNDSDITNKKYVDAAVAGGGGGGITNLDGGVSNSNFGGVAISPIDGGASI